MSDTDVVFNEFEKKIKEQGLSIDSVDETGLVLLEHRGIKFKISLDNAIKDYHLEGTLETVTGIVNSILEPFNYTFEEIQTLIFPHFIPFDMEVDSSEIEIEKVTPKAYLIYVVNKNGGQTYIMNSTYKKWGKTFDEIKRIGMSNLNSLLTKCKIDTLIIENRVLGYFYTEFSLKTSFLAATKLKEKVESNYGWPIYAVFPVKDFCYIFSEKDFDFFSAKLGSTVLKEFNKSPHPVSTEIIKISDDGIEAIGQYKENNI